MIKETISEAERQVRKDAFFLMARLEAAGIKEVLIDFNGSGDDGSVEDITFDGGPNEEFNDELENWAYALLDTTNVDWVNNEGGYGEINWDVEKRSYTYSVNERIETSRLAAHGTVAFADQEVEDETNTAVGV